MLIMEPNGSIEPASPAPTADGVDNALERVLTFSEDLGREISTEVHAMVDAKLASIAARLGHVPNGAVWSPA